MNDVFRNEEINCELRIITRDGFPWFVAKDVADSLGYVDTAQAIRGHCKGVVDFTLPSKGGNQLTKIIPEPDLYRLILRSNKPEAEKFQDWVTEEVLPSIRKSGSYSVNNKTDNDHEMVIRMAVSIVKEREEKEKLELEKDLFGNKTAYGQISEVNGKPRVKPVHGYLRTVKDGYEFQPDTIQLKLFNLDNSNLIE